MADEEKPDPNIAIVDTSDPNIQTVYANNTFVEIGESEISLIFGYDFYHQGRKVDKPSVRVVLTHDSFMRMVEFWEKRSKFLRRVYANRMPNLYAGDPKEHQAALDELFPATKNEKEDSKDERD